MTLSGISDRQAPKPTPPAAAKTSFASRHPTTGKRFTVRDGFHLKTRNAETQAVIDAQLSGREEPPDLPEWDDTDGCEVSSGPTKQEIISAAAGNINNNNNLDDGGTVSTAAAVLDQLLQPEHSNHDTSELTTGRVHVALREPAEWLIHRHRPSGTKQRKQRKVDKLLNEMLHEPVKAVDGKQDEMRPPRRPRCQSMLGSTYSERVAAARPPKQISTEHKNSYRREQLQPLTATERELLRSREDNNKAVDKLLISLFHPATPPTAAMTTPSNRFSTRRSIIRHETAVALRSRNLVSRMNELRSLPQLLEQMETLQLLKKQQHIAEHGVDIVARNRANPTWQVLQKPSQTPLLPSATDHKVHQAHRRKQELDAAKEENVRRIVVRWQVRREQRAEQARRAHVQSQWLLVVAIAESSKKWLAKFHEFRQKRGVLVRVIMAQRLQRYWRQRSLAKHNSLRFGPITLLSSAFFRMPVVIRAVAKLQQSIRDWLEHKHRRERTEVVSLIVTVWFEFQDVKFRRIILRFRKRVRDFQTMWRSWRAITAARIKLLLLVWARLDRKVRRRHGVTNLSLTNDILQLKGSTDDASPLVGKGLTLLDMLQRTEASRPSSQEHKQMEDIHRHFRNGGAVHTSIRAVSPGPLGSYSPANTTSPSRGVQASPFAPSFKKSNKAQQTANTHVQQDLQLTKNMGEEFQLVMYDVYTTHQNLLLKPSKSPARSVIEDEKTREAKRSPDKTRQSLPHGSPVKPPPPIQLPSASPTMSVPPPLKKVPHQVKVTVLRHLLSEKRKMYSNDRDRGREAWAAARKQMRSEAFRYDVLDEVAAFQQLQAKYATFLLLHSITETEMVNLIHKTQIEINAPTSLPSQSRRKSVLGVGGPRKSQGDSDIATNLV